MNFLTALLVDRHKRGRLRHRGDFDSQYRGLMDAGITFAQKFNLRPGIALTPSQVAQLTTDIVWFESQPVSLGNGRIEQYDLYTKSLSDGADAALKGTLHAFNHPEDVLKPIGFGIANCLKEDMCISAGKEMLSDSGKAVWQSGKDILGEGYRLDDVNYLYGKNMVNEIDAIAAVRGGTALLELTGVGKAAGKAASTIGDAAVNYVRFKLPKGSNANEVLPIVGETKGYDLESVNYEAHNLVNYEKYKQQLRQENLDNIAKLYPELSHAALGKNNFTYKGKMFTKAESDELGRAWVGPNYEVTSQGGFISEDRTRRYRPATSKKNSSYADTGIQSNFERFYIDPITGSSKVESNLHLNIYEDKK